ncbi:response regulator [Anabaena azotica]|uniref:histidine kinase n=1 Tax=Anabaena azotica FACHB-119 TaxID=947527 RepID=A0ABR8DFH2_9NOST|nr:response regulator [Anabaena azotica]MBD2505273.1 response regulator [Anabaena azotica FACHB-119]
MKILVVEDDKLNAHALTAVLTDQNYAVEVAVDGDEAWDLIETYDYDLILLDVMLPKLDGISLCRQIRSSGRQMPILLLTGCDSGHEKAIGLDAGADDYVVKPFDQEELVARVRALLRRGGTTAQPILECGNLRLDPSSCEVRYNQHLLSLTPKEYALLELFLRNNRRVFSCSMILEHIWSYEDTPGEEAVRTHIKGLRMKLRNAGAPGDLVETVYGIGYRLKQQEEEGRHPQATGTGKSQQQTLTAIAGIWQKFYGRVDEQVRVLEQAAIALTQKALNWELRSQATREAHTLAGSLGTFGLPEGSKLARKIEQLLKSEKKLTSAEIKNLQTWVKSLRQEVAAQEPKASLPSTTEAPHLQQQPQAEAKVLAVDDDPQILALLQTLLHPWGLQVITLDDPRQFWEKLADVNPDLLILDVEMPHANGIEICQVVRNDTQWSELPILFLTVHNDREIVNQVFSVGADDFVSKPIVGPELVTRIINRLERVKLLRKVTEGRGVGVQGYRGVGEILSPSSPSSPSSPPTPPTEAALRESQERLSLALEAVNLGIWDWNLVTNEIIWSEGHARLFGIEPGKFDGSYESFQGFIHPEDREDLARVINNACQHKTDYNHEFRIIWPDGSIHWIEGTGKLYYNEKGEAVRMLGVVRDVTSRKQIEATLHQVNNELELRVAQRTAELVNVNRQLHSQLDERRLIEEALRISQVRLARILDIADDAIISIDGSQRITLFNQGAEKIFGYCAAEIIGQRLDTLIPQRFAQAHRQHVADFGQAPSLARRMGERREIFGCRQDGTEFPAEASISKFNLDQEVFYTVILRDVTERKQIERMKDEFVSVVSHELRTPLTSIHGSLGMLTSGLLPANSEQGKRLLQIATDSTERLVRLINDILDIERIESGRVKMERETCELTDLIESAVSIMQPLANKAGVKLSISSPSMQLWVDPDRIVQTLTNLLSNAIKFSTPEKTVWLVAQQYGDELLLTVKDNGRGIPTDKLDSIFERFQQVDSSDSRNHEGTGLGLAICQSIVQQHGGRIWVESILGEGSSFYFTLPILPIPDPEIPPSPAPSSQSPLVLVCDDDPAIRTELQTLLEQGGYRVVTVATGEDAIALASTHHPDVIVLDLLIPGMNGWETMAMLKESAQTKYIPIVICSVYKPTENTPPTGDFVDWVSKPVQESYLLQSLRQAITTSSRRVRILIVEDDADLAELLVTLFERHDIETFLAKNGREAIHLSQEVNPDLLILDLILPETDGFAVVDWLQNHNRLCKVPVVVYSAKDLEESERKRLKLGHTEFLTKGRVTTQEFEQRVIELLQRITHVRE